jgi:probable F420-dependent oxidoreductase
VATSRIGLATAVALPTESDPLTLAKTIATLDYLSAGRVTVGAGFGWNTDELADHGVPPGQRRTVLREYLEAMRALWTQETPSYDGQFVRFGPCWALPKPVQPHVPVIIGAGGGPKTLAWIARHADGWMTTPGEQDIPGKAAALRDAWAGENRPGAPDIRVLVAARPSPGDLAAWAAAGVTELLWGLPDAPAGAAEAYLDRLAARVAAWLAPFPGPAPRGRARDLPDAPQGRTRVRTGADPDRRRPPAAAGLRQERNDPQEPD